MQILLAVSTQNSVMRGLRERVCIYCAPKSCAARPYSNALLQQYQDAIRAHKAGRKVNFSELPVPPGKFVVFVLNI